MRKQAKEEAGGRQMVKGPEARLRAGDVVLYIVFCKDWRGAGGV